MRNHQEWMDALPLDRRARIEAETARLVAVIDQHEAERRMAPDSAGRHPPDNQRERITGDGR